MDIERIKEIKLLTSLKSTDDKGKPIVWLAGQVFKPGEKPVPQPILRELTEKRRGGPIVEVTFKPEPPPISVVEEPQKAQQEVPDIIPDDIPEEKPEEPVVETVAKKPVAKKPAVKRAARRSTQKK